MSHRDDVDDDENEDEEEPRRRPRERSSGSRALVILLVGGSLAFVAVGLACCGGVMMFGLQVVTAEVEQQLRDNPRLVEHLGPVTSFKMNIVRSMAAGGDETFIYDVVGAKGSGELQVEQGDGPDGSEIVRSARLRLSDGLVVDLLAADDRAPPP